MSTNAQKSTIEATITATTLALQFSEDNGTITLDAALLSDDIRTQAMMHGLKQKLVDAAAIARNTETGRSATPKDKFDAIREVYERLLAGQWNKGREAGSATGGLLLRALMQMTGKDRPTMVTWLEGKTDKEKAALRTNPKVAAIIATLKPEPKVAASGLDTDAMLGELDG